MVVRWEKRGIRVVEVYFDRTDQLLDADVVRYQNFSQPAGGSAWSEAPTRQIDLRPEPQQILAQMRRRSRRKLKAAESMSLRYECDFTGDREWVREFCDFFDRFAPLKRLPAANRGRIEGMRASGVLFLSRVRDSSGEVLVWHAYYFVHGVARLFHSASLFRARTDATGKIDREFADTVAEANAYLHWMDMLQARAMGCHTYDFGSWHAGQDPENLKINEFKQGFGGQVVCLYDSDQARTWKGVAACYGRRIQRVLRGNR